MTAGEPQSANDYDDRTTAAVKSVLIEIGPQPPLIHCPLVADGEQWKPKVFHPRICT